MVISLGRILSLLIASWYLLELGSSFGFDIDVYTGQQITDTTFWYWLNSSGFHSKKPTCSIPVHSRCPLPFVRWLIHSAQTKIKIVYRNYKIALLASYCNHKNSSEAPTVIHNNFTVHSTAVSWVSGWGFRIQLARSVDRIKCPLFLILVTQTKNS